MNIQSRFKGEAEYFNNLYDTNIAFQVIQKEGDDKQLNISVDIGKIEVSFTEAQCLLMIDIYKKNFEKMEPQKAALELADRFNHNLFLAEAALKEFNIIASLSSPILQSPTHPQLSAFRSPLMESPLLQTNAPKPPHGLSGPSSNSSSPLHSPKSAADQNLARTIAQRVLLLHKKSSPRPWWSRRTVIGVKWSELVVNLLTTDQSIDESLGTDSGGLDVVFHNLSAPTLSGGEVRLECVSESKIKKLQSLRISSDVITKSCFFFLPIAFGLSIYL